jgi:hypothetical protein
MTTELWVVFGFGAIFLIARLAIAILVPNPTVDQEAVFRTVLSLSAAGVAAALPGLLSIESKTAATTISGTGALGVFVLVYLFNPGSVRKVRAVSDATVQSTDLDIQNKKIEVLQRRITELEAQLASRAKPAPPRRASLTDKAIISAFAALLLAVLIVYAVALPTPTPFQAVVVRMVFALCGAGVGLTLPGILQVGSPSSRILFRVISALMMFLIIFFFARLGVDG